MFTRRLTIGIVSCAIALGAQLISPRIAKAIPPPHSTGEERQIEGVLAKDPGGVTLVYAPGSYSRTNYPLWFDAGNQNLKQWCYYHSVPMLPGNPLYEGVRRVTMRVRFRSQHNDDVVALYVEEWKEDPEAAQATRSALNARPAGPERR